MKVQLTVTLDVDPEIWDDEHHCGTKRGDVHADVTRYAHTLIDATFGSTEGITAVTIRPGGRPLR